MALFLLSAHGWLYGQEEVYLYYYRVYFKDKGENSTANFAPEDLLSARALDRRKKAGIDVPDFRDLPVFSDYINQIRSAGFTLHSSSKWMNTALFKTQVPVDINILLDLQFVGEVKIVKRPAAKSAFNNKLAFQTEQSDFPPYNLQVSMVNGNLIHNSGFDGKNILIAVLDGGFLNADKISSLYDLLNRNGIKAGYDFVNKNKSVYNTSTHGTAVLSILAGNIPGFIEGTAPGADYLLLKTEDVTSEFPCEEDFWAAGAEFADSAGADIISSSLGYFNFDDPLLNYKYADLNGNTTFVTRAAEIAASKGIIVVNSAGNERDKTWKYIIPPSDGDSVMAIGAVDWNKNISSFSSAGPTSDGRVKPDNVAMGVGVSLQISTSGISRSNGTSFSCPVISGMAACLMQAVPQATSYDIIKVMHLAGDRASSPDSLYGFGIPDMVHALSELQDIYIKTPDEETIAWPNPTTGEFELIFRRPPVNFTMEIFSITGKLIYRKDFHAYTGRSIKVTELQNRDQGVYFIRLFNADGVSVQKIIKLRN